MELTACDHEANGFVALARWEPSDWTTVRAFVAVIDRRIDDESEPDIHTAPFTFILDILDGQDMLIDTGKRSLPLQEAMRLAPAEVAAWLDERPDPDNVADRKPPSVGPLPMPETLS